MFVSLRATAVHTKVLVVLPYQMSSSPPSSAFPQRLSLVAQTVKHLCDCISAGHWREHLPGERELSAQLQVSRPTLRAALHELQRTGWLDVKQRQRRRIQPTRLMGGTESQPKAVAMLTPVTLRLMTPSVLLVIDAVREHLARAGWTLEIHVNRSCYSARPARALEKLVSQSPAAAWLLSGTIHSMQDWFQRRAVPCLVLGTCPNDIALPFVDANHRATCRHAGALFLRKGHRRIAMVLPEGTTGGDRDSERGICEAVERQSDASLLVLRHRDKTHLCELLDRALQSSSPPTAYLVARAVHALTVTTHLIRRGVRLPQDAAVLSRDDENFLAHSCPPVSRYSVSNEHFARKVSQTVRKLADNGMIPSRAIQFMPKLILGETL